MEPRPQLGRLLPWTLAIIALVRAWPYFFFSPDDYYIYLRFVQNLVEHGELSFNTGEPTYGFTSALWLLVLGAAAKVTGSAMLAGKILSLAATATSPVLLYFVMRRLTGETGLSFLAGLVWAGNAWLVRWSGSGMEAGLSATLALAVVLFAMRARERGSAPWGAGIAAGLAPLVRPEMVGLTILLVFFWALTDPATGSTRRKNSIALLLPPALILGAALSGLYLHFGRIFPNTAEAKGAMVDGLAKLVPSVERTLKIVASTSALEMVIFAIAVTVWLYRGRWRGFWERRDPGFVLLMTAWSLGVIGLYGVRGVTAYTRYLLIFMPFVVIGGFAPLAAWWRAGGRRQFVVLAIGAAALVQNTALDLRLIRPATIAYQESERRVNIVIGEWLRDNSDPDAVVAVPDIGAIAYVSRRKILDLNGLVTPELIAYKRDKNINGFLEENPPEFIISIDPDPKWLEKNGPDLPLSPVMSLPFEKMFLFQDGPLFYSLYRVLPVEEAPTEGIARVRSP
jgi:hypothetical protein